MIHIPLDHIHSSNIAEGTENDIAEKPGGDNVENEDIAKREDVVKREDIAKREDVVKREDIAKEDICKR